MTYPDIIFFYYFLLGCQPPVTSQTVQQPPQISRCESPLRYPQSGPLSYGPHQVGSHPSVSAFCAPPQPSHCDNSGEFFFFFKSINFYLKILRFPIYPELGVGCRVNFFFLNSVYVMISQC